MPKSFTEALQESVLVFDGAMGTEIYRNHVFTNRCYDELNLSDAKLIRRIHESYRNAGADVLTTNTFGANRLVLEKYGLADQVTQINQAGAALARSVANAPSVSSNDTVSNESKNIPALYIAGSVGPLPPGAILQRSEEELLAVLREQISALIVGQVDFIFFETLPSRSSLVLAAKAMASFNGFPFILSCAFDAGKVSVLGEPLTQLFAPLPDEVPRPIALGLNCGLGPDGLLSVVEEAIKIVSLPLIVQPNAGIPKEFDGRLLYYCSPEYIATYAMRYVDLGVAAVGGCCGTTADHIAEIVQMVKPLSKGRRQAVVLMSAHEEVQPQPETPIAERSRLAAKLTQGKWVTTVELVPPRGYDLTATVEKCRMLSRFGIDAVNLPDGPRASSRISSLVVADKILHEACIEPILHFCCRDKNLIGMQADLLACAAYGIHNILFITGDPPKLGNYPNATGVFDTDSIGMCSIQKRLNTGIDLGGLAILPPTRTLMGVGVDPNALDQDREMERLRRKIAAGAEFVITQPVFDAEGLKRFLDKSMQLLEKNHCRAVPLIAGVWPLASYRNAVFMQNEVPGVVIPDSIMQRMEKAASDSKDAQLAIGIEIAREMIQEIRSVVQGVQVNTPFGRIEIAFDVLS